MQSLSAFVTDGLIFKETKHFPQRFIKHTKTQAKNAITFSRASKLFLMERREALTCLLWLSLQLVATGDLTEHWLRPPNSSPSFPEGAEFGHCKTPWEPFSQAFLFGHSPLNSLLFVFDFCQRWRSKCVASLWAQKDAVQAWAPCSLANGSHQLWSMWGPQSLLSSCYPCPYPWVLFSCHF